jgi:hypothetical protein
MADQTSKTPEKPFATPGSIAFTIVLAIFLLWGYVSVLSRHPGPPGPDVKAKGDVYSMVRAQQAFEGAFGAYAGDLSCLVDPSDCAAGYPPTAPAFIDEGMLTEVRHSYRRTFHPGSPQKSEARGTVSCFAYVAHLDEGFAREMDPADYPSFCSDCDGACMTRDGLPPKVVDGRCVVEPPPEGLLAKLGFGPEAGPGACFPIDLWVRPRQGRGDSSRR